MLNIIKNILEEVTTYLYLNFEPVQKKIRVKRLQVGNMSYLVTKNNRLYTQNPIEYIGLWNELTKSIDTTDKDIYEGEEIEMTECDYDYIMDIFQNYLSHKNTETIQEEIQQILWNCFNNDFSNDGGYASIHYRIYKYKYDDESEWNTIDEHNYKNDIEYQRIRNDLTEDIEFGEYNYNKVSYIKYEAIYNTTEIQIFINDILDSLNSSAVILK
jgi:hypothetical protein